MKYLQDDDLARWTAALSSELTGNTASSGHGSGSSRRLQMSSAMMMAGGGGGSGGGGGGAGSSGGNTARRRLQGRLEAYSMKRAGNDKQYAQVLGKKFVEQIHEAQQQLADCKLKQQQQQQQQQQHDSNQQQQHQKQQAQKVLHRKRSQSVGGVEAILSSGSSSSPTRNRKDETVGKAAEGPGDDMASAASGRKKDALPLEAMEAAPCKKRKRAVSFDSAVLGPSRKKKGQKHQQHAIMGASVPTGLGDFTEQSTRRLMTDLILTLNSSFPDYDFSETKASDFTAVSVPVAVRRINERLSEWAISSSGNGGGSGENCASSRIHNLWTAVDKSIRLTECQVYVYQPGTGEAGNATLLDDSYMEDDYDDDDDVQNLVAESDDEVGAGAASSSSSPPIVLWSFYYLFVNKNLKRILLFSCVETMKRQYMAYNNYYEDDDTDRLLEGEDDANTSMPTYFYPSADAADTQDYIDLDPEAPTAGGIPESSI